MSWDGWSGLCRFKRGERRVLFVLPASTSERVFEGLSFFLRVLIIRIITELVKVPDVRGTLGLGKVRGGDALFEEGPPRDALEERVDHDVPASLRQVPQPLFGVANKQLLDEVLHGRVDVGRPPFYLTLYNLLVDEHRVVVDKRRFAAQDLVQQDP